MKFRERTDEELHISLTPLIDVVFLLLIFFMVSTTFSKESQLQIRLPEASDEPAAMDQERMLYIEISRESFFVVKGPGGGSDPLPKPSLATLRHAVSEAAGGEFDLRVVIRADRETPHESVVRAMDVARRLGYTRLTFSIDATSIEPSATDDG